ncbi:disease resistance protein RPV1 [Vitis vinifera]|nr:disease resistance protein RPV1 [Vitis vinifera]XP_010645906.1 disease resistance protein RPV1 [Vitis vinifera]|eukprot:XP_010645905.1 PREDICTED: TMV resistance protein N-like isoform X1 [Vitis vinifera]
MASAAAASSSSQRRYDVFLSFRGEDTRNNFTAHLYHALCQKGINTFIDDDKLERGQVISPALVAAIENSMYSIVVLSKNYASSRWCLQELVKIVECMKSKRQMVFPIFYDVDPSEVRRHRGTFGEALAKHEENSENMERVESWKDALTQVANLSGWDSRNKNEHLLIKGIVTDILNKLLTTSISDTVNLVGIDARMQEIEMRLCLEFDDFLMVGIWGMGGIGKTTLARAIYRKIRGQFEACCFFENVEEDLANEGLIKLQQKFLAQLLEEPNLNMKALTSIKERLHLKKVLIVLDNVNDPIILKCLVGNRDWFGQGSRIIITTRDERLLISHGVLNCYEARRFNYDEAKRFLSHYLLKHEILRDDFIELSREVIGYAQGLPLALEVLGSFLFSMTKEEWRNQLDKLKSTPNMKIQEVLKVSYKGLDDKEKNIFLDIACFFKGEDKDYVMEILDGCGFFSLSGIRALIEKTLITISWNNKLMMHDLIQEMGREIVRQQSLEEPSKRSRLWFHEDIYDVLQKNTATEKIEGIFLNLSHLEEMLDFTTQALARMNRLRLLKVYKSKNISRNFKDISNMENCKVNFSKDFKFCYHELRCLYFYGYSLKSLPIDFNPKNLVELSMPYSHIKQLWKGLKVLEKLKFMDLSHSKYLIETPNFQGVTNLKRLVLEDCVSLRKVHSSLGDLKNLSFLNLKNCKMLKSLPSSTCDLKSLETFILSGCSKFEGFPENFGSLEMLKELYADEIAIRVLPSSFSFLRNLKILSFKGCKGPLSTLWLLPRRTSNSIGSILQPLSGLCSLTTLNLSNCNLSDEPNLSSLGFLSSLEDLHLGGNDFVTLPSTISRLSNLKRLELENCRRLQALPELPSSIYHIYAENCTSLKGGSHQVLKSLLPTGKHQKRKFMGYFVASIASMAFIPGSRIPDWVTYQSSGSEVKAELPPNWFNSNLLGFALSVVIFPQVCYSTIVSMTVSFDNSSSFEIGPRMLHFNGRLESDHVCLFYLRLHQLMSNCSQVTRLKISFKTFPMGGQIEIKRCGVGLVYSNEDGVGDSPPMIQFNSISSPPPPPPPPNKSTVVLEEIHEGEPSGNGCSNVDGSEEENSEYHTADEEEPSTATACSEDHSESVMRPQKRLKCRH